MRPEVWPFVVSCLLSLDVQCYVAYEIWRLNDNAERGNNLLFGPSSFTESSENPSPLPYPTVIWRWNSQFDKCSFSPESMDYISDLEASMKLGLSYLRPPVFGSTTSRLELIEVWYELIQWNYICY